MLEMLTQSPWQVVIDLLVGEPDAQSALSEASRRDKLAIQSAEALSHCERDRQAARRRWEELRHRLDPRSRRSLNIVAGMTALALTGGGLLWLGLAELSGVAGGPLVPGGPLRLALCATLIWLVAAWRAARAVREGEARLAGLIVAGSAGSSLLLATSHLLASWSAHLGRTAGILTVLAQIVALTLAAQALISRTEPAAVAMARGSWRQAERRCRQAAGQSQRDASLASAAIEAWLDLARRHAIQSQQAYGHDRTEDFVEAVVAAAATLYALGRPPSWAAARRGREWPSAPW